MSSNMIQIMLCLIFMQLCMIAQSTSTEEDKIIALPGQPKVNFQQYAGYITVDDKTNRSFFYYFVEAAEKPQSRSLILWMGGGQGCATISGSAFGGHGPFRVNGGQLFPNDHSFNKVANVLYVDSPAGAGFSYSPDGSLEASINDEHIARDNLVFLQRWLEKFTAYNNSELYLGGESYAGHSVPGLAELIIQTKLKRNLKGIMLISPLLDSASEIEAIPKYIWSHGLISDSTYKLLTDKPACNIVTYMDEYMMELRAGDKSGYRSPECVAVHKKLNFEYQSYEQKGLFDIYNVKGDICTAKISGNAKLNEPDLTRCKVDLGRSYLNRADVQKTLRVRTPLVPCNKGIIGNYSKASLKRSMMPTLKLLVRSKVNVLIVSGDQDGRVPFTSTRSLVTKLGNDLKLRVILPYVPWVRSNIGEQVGGWMEYYDNAKLVYATIKGGDHSARGKYTENALALFHGLLCNSYLAVKDQALVQIYFNTIYNLYTGFEYTV